MLFPHWYAKEEAKDAQKYSLPIWKDKTFRNLQNCCRSLIVKTLMAFENADDICACLFDAQRPNLDKTRTRFLLIFFSVASPVPEGLVLVQWVRPNSRRRPPFLKSIQKIHVQSTLDITVICIEGLYFICTYMTNDDNTSFEEEIVLQERNTTSKNWT